MFSLVRLKSNFYYLKATLENVLNIQKLNLQLGSWLNSDAYVPMVLWIFPIFSKNEYKCMNVIKDYQKCIFVEFNTAKEKNA